MISPMARPLRYGLIGAGMMGQEHIRNIALLDGAQVVAIHDPDPGMSAAAQALAPGARQAATVEALLDMAEIDALVIASPNHLHLDQLERIAALRPLPVLVEKPVFTEAAQEGRIAALAEYPALLWVAMEYRYMPPIAEFLARADAATGGVRMLTIREHRFPFLDKVGGWNRFNRFTGGTMVEKCCHFFDLMRLALGAEPVRVMASAGQAVNHLDEAVNGAAPDIWDHGYVLVDFDGGARAMLELCMFAKGRATRRNCRRSVRPARSKPSCPAPAGSGPTGWARRRSRAWWSARARPVARSKSRCRSIPICWKRATTTAPPSISTGCSPKP